MTRPDLPRPPAPLRQPPQPRLHGPDGPGHGELRLPPIDRPPGRPRRRRTPSPARLAARSGAPCRRSSRRWPASGWSSTRRTSPSPPTRRLDDELHVQARGRRSVRPPGRNAWSRSAGIRSRPRATVPAAPATPTRRRRRAPGLRRPRRARRLTRSTSSSPETPGEVVAPVAATRRRPTASSVPVTRSRRSPGLYRLVGTIHGKRRRRLRRGDPGADARAHRPGHRLAGRACTTPRRPPSPTAGGTFKLHVGGDEPRRGGVGRPGDPVTTSAAR